MGNLDAIFKAYDIRGVVGEQIDAQTCRLIGSAFGVFVKRQGSSRVAVGRDMREDGPRLAHAFVEGVRHSGVDVTDIGLCATEMIYFASGLWGIPAAMFTASHNPAGYNGIKLCGPGASPIGSTSGLTEIKALASSPPARATTTGSITTHGLLDDYVEHVTSFVQPDRLEPLRVVVDSANGMGGLIVPAVFGSLGIEVDHLYPELDGNFPNHPADPLEPANQQDLKHRVREVGADLGLAFDGDADRVFAVDEQATSLPGSLLTALISQVMLEREPKASIVYNLICSKALPEAILEWGGKPVRCRVGHSFMKQAMATSGAVFGGEHSGHYYYRDNWCAESSMVTSLLLMEALSGYCGSLSQLAAPLRRFASSGEINSTVADPGKAIETVAAWFRGFKQDRLDGLTVDCGEWWFNLRPSNTEPLLRLNLEAPDATAVDVRVSEIRAMLRLHDA